MPPRGGKRKVTEKDAADLQQKETIEESSKQMAGANKGNDQTKVVESKGEESAAPKKAVKKGRNTAVKKATEEKVEAKEDPVELEVVDGKKMAVQMEEKNGGNQEPPAKKNKGKGKKEVKEEEKEKVIESKKDTVTEPTPKETVPAKRGKKQAQSKKEKQGNEEKEKENEEKPGALVDSIEEDGKKKTGQAKAGTKRKAQEVDDVTADTELETRRGRSKVAKIDSDDVDAGDEVAVSKTGKNATDWSKVTFKDAAKSKDGRPWSKKFSSWNVNGIRAWLNNQSFAYIQKESPDIFCLQETKCDVKELPMDELKIQGYYDYWSSGDKKGYSGTGIYTKEKPLSIAYGIGVAEHDAEGRVITLEFEKYFFVVAYVPNSGDKLKRLDYRQKWNVDFTAFLKKLDASKPVILSGDLNVAHNEIDLANPKGNTKTAGFTKQERDDFSILLKAGFVDSYRHLYPEKTKAYTYWSYRSNARAKNTGWRLDYFVLSERLMKDVCDCVIRSEVYGSDHCPLVLLMAL